MSPVALTLQPIPAGWQNWRTQSGCACRRRESKNPETKKTVAIPVLVIEPCQMCLDVIEQLHWAWLRRRRWGRKEGSWALCGLPLRSDLEVIACERLVLESCPSGLIGLFWRKDFKSVDQLTVALRGSAVLVGSFADWWEEVWFATLCPCLRSTSRAGHGKSLAMRNVFRDQRKGCCSNVKRVNQETHWCYIIYNMILL